jgi:alanine dehydrogenase
VKIGIPKEIKNNEYRVGMTPAGVDVLVSEGHELYVETKAGTGTGFEDADYEKVGAKILGTADEVFKTADMIIKIKEPLDPEFPRLRKGQILFTYLHLAGDKQLTLNTLETGCIGIAYETMESKNGSLPLLVPMSEVAGRLATVEGAKYMQRTYGGRGIFLGGVPGTQPAQVLVLGAGIVGRHSMEMAVGLGADVTIMTRNVNRLRDIDAIYQGRVKTLKMTPYYIREAVKEADLIVGSVLVTGDKAPWIITKKMLKTMRKGAVIVDVSIDQGGCCETSKPTTHSEPIYEVDGVIHYCVANMPGCVPRTSTFALTNETLPYAVEIANKGWKQACKDNYTIKTGLNTFEGKLTYKPVADVFDLEYTPPEDVL